MNAENDDVAVAKTSEDVDDEARSLKLRHEIVDALFEEVLANVPHSPLVVVNARTSVADVVRAMNDKHTGCALVADDRTGVLVGIFTERDVLRRVAVRPLDADRTPISEVMTRDPDTLPADATLAYALRQMSVEGYRNIPLVDHDQRPVGVVAVQDIVAWLCESFPGSVLNLPPAPQSFASEDGG
jgi:CBS domain-containing protein